MATTQIQHTRALAYRKPWMYGSWRISYIFILTSVFICLTVPWLHHYSKIVCWWC